MKTNKKSPLKPPAHLRPETAEWWSSVVAEFALEQHHLRLLTGACTAWDRAENARESITENGAVFIDRFKQPKMRPEVLIERDSRVLFSRLLRELGLDVEDESDPKRPPIISSRRYSEDD